MNRIAIDVEEKIKWCMEPLNEIPYHISELEKLLEKVKQSELSQELTKQQKQEKIQHIEAIISNIKSTLEQIIKVNLKYSIPPAQALGSRN